MGQPGMRVTVDAAMRARDVSRPGVDPALEDMPGTRSAGPDAPPPPNGDEAGDRAERDDVDAGAQRDRRGKAERRRLSKRHARAPR